MLSKWHSTEPRQPSMDSKIKTNLLGLCNGVAVLKEPMGSSGEGIYFCQTIQQVYQQMERHKNLASEDGDYLDNIMNIKGRMPAWGM